LSFTPMGEKDSIVIKGQSGSVSRGVFELGKRKKERTFSGSIDGVFCQRGRNVGKISDLMVGSEKKALFKGRRKICCAQRWKEGGGEERQVRSLIKSGGERGGPIPALLGE